MTHEVTREVTHEVEEKGVRLKDLLWPWGAVKDREQEIALLVDRLHDMQLARFLQIESSMANIEYGARQREIAANLRSECLRLHEEIERTRDVVRGAAREIASPGSEGGEANDGVMTWVGAYVFRGKEGE